MPQFSAGFTAGGENVGDNTLSELGYNRLAASSRPEKRKEKEEEDGKESHLSRLTMHSLVVRFLDILLAIALLPYETWRLVSNNDRLTIMLRIVLEVTLELIMWTIFAGASILTAATLVLDDLCCGDGAGCWRSTLNREPTSEGERRPRGYAILLEGDGDLTIRRGNEIDP